MIHGGRLLRDHDTMIGIAFELTPHRKKIAIHTPFFRTNPINILSPQTDRYLSHHKAATLLDGNEAEDENDDDDHDHGDDDDNDHEDEEEGGDDDDDFYHEHVHDKGEREKKDVGK